MLINSLDAKKTVKKRKTTLHIHFATKAPASGGESRVTKLPPRLEFTGMNCVRFGESRGLHMLSTERNEGNPCPSQSGCEECFAQYVY